MKNWIKTMLQNKKRSEISPLSPHEKIQLQSQFWKYMDEHPLPQRITTFDSFWNRKARASVPQMALIVFVCVLGSIAYMAEESEPGETLYVVKRNLNEEVLLGVSELLPEFHAQVNTTLLSRRLEDMEKLIVLNEFETTDSVELRTDINEHTESIHEYIAEAEASGKTDKALLAGLRLDTLLDAHMIILSMIEKKAYAEQFIIETAHKRDVTEDMMEKLLEIEASTIEAYRQEEILTLLDEVQDIHKKVEKQVSAHTTIENEYTRMEVTKAIETSLEAYRRAQEDLEQGKNASAVKELRRAIDDASIASILLDSYEILRPYLETEHSQ